MEKEMAHPALEMRIKTLGARIAALQRKLDALSESQRLKKEAELRDLVRRQHALAERLLHIENESPGMRRSAEAELALLADDIAGAIDGFVFSIDAHYNPKRETKQNDHS